MMTDKFRGTGRTTRQMKEAPKHAIFVWCNDRTKVAERMARDLGREDLKIVPPSWITNERWQGMTLTGIVVDHATWDSLSPRSTFNCLLRHAWTRIRVTPNSVDG
jgi:hypothetical protein